jgi:hypothetical protein
VALAGGIGGLINAALCYWRLPVPIQDSSALFEWHVMPAGCVHGAILAVVAMGASRVALRFALPWKWLAGLLVGWLGGYLSWIALDLSAFHTPLAQAWIWPFVNHDSALDALWSPFCSFGGVTLMLYLWLISKSRARALGAHIAAAATAGTLGSLWWWIIWETWYFSLLHGVIWGVSVGLALARLEQSQEIEVP